MFDPLGVAARDVRECLLIQLRTLAPDNTLAQQIVSDHLKQLQNKQYREIARALDRPVKSVERCVEIIRKLDPRPGQRFNNSQTRLIEPDVAFVRTGDGYQVVLNEDGLPQLRLSHHYRRMLGEDGTTREVRNYVKERFTSAIQLIKNIEQRKQTIIRVCEAIIRRQKEFLDKGIDQLRPMMIKEVAEEVGVHPSTVSRAVANKYAHTPQGVYELALFLFRGRAGTGGRPHFFDQSETAGEENDRGRRSHASPDRRADYASSARSGLLCDAPHRGQISRGYANSQYPPTPGQSVRTGHGTR